MSDEQQTDQMEKSRTLLRSENMALTAKLTFPKQELTDDEISFPKDLSNTTDDELSRMMGQYSSLIAYAQFVFGQATIEFIAKKSAYDIERAKLYTVYRRDDRMTEKEREAALELNSSLRPKKFDMVQAEAYMKLVEALLQGYNQKYAVLSRELTRKGYRNDRGFA